MIDLGANRLQRVNRALRRGHTGTVTDVITFQRTAVLKNDLTEIRWILRENDPANAATKLRAEYDRLKQELAALESFAGKRELAINEPTAFVAAILELDDTIAARQGRPRKPNRLELAISFQKARCKLYLEAIKKANGLRIAR
jgi:hypothetical protein